MWRADLLEKTLMLVGIGGRRRRGWQRMKWLDGITDSMAWVWVNSGSWWWTGWPGVLQFMGSQKVRHNWVSELNRAELNGKSLIRNTLINLNWILAQPLTSFVINELFSFLNLFHFNKRTIMPNSKSVLRIKYYLYDIPKRYLIPGTNFQNYHFYYSIDTLTIIEKC